MTFRSDATEGVWSPTQNVAVQTEANVVAIFFFHQCGFYDPTHHIRGCQKIIWNFALKGRALRDQHERFEEALPDGFHSVISRLVIPMKPKKRHRRAVTSSVLISARVIFSRIVGYLNSGRVEVTIVVALETEV